MAEAEPARLYALSTCVHCKALIEFLEENRVAFSFVNIDELEGKERRDMVKEVKRLNPRCTFPTLVAGEQVVVGFRIEEIRKVLNI